MLGAPVDSGSAEGFASSSNIKCIPEALQLLCHLSIDVSLGFKLGQRVSQELPRRSGSRPPRELQRRPHPRWQTLSVERPAAVEIQFVVATRRRNTS